jgi:hypothetical protein
MTVETNITFHDSIRAIIKDRCKPVDVRSRFVEMLDDSWAENDFLRTFHLTPSTVIEECDPTMFQQELLNFTDSCDDLIEIDEEYYDREDVEAVKADLINDIESL